MKVNHSQAQQLRSNVQRAMEQLKSLDNQPLDRNPQEGHIDIPWQEAPVGNLQIQRDVDGLRQGQLSPTKGYLAVESYDNYSRGEGSHHLDEYRYQVRQGRDGFLGLIGQPQRVESYSYSSQAGWSEFNHREKASFDQEGRLLKFSQADGPSLGQSFGEVVTTPAGLTLIGISAALGAYPGSLGNALLGPVGGGLAFAGATTLALTALKTWS